MLVCNNRSRPGSRFSVMRFWLDLTATPLHTHRERKTSRTWRGNTRTSAFFFFFRQKKTEMHLKQTHALWFLPCLSRREMMDLMWFSWMMLRTSGLSMSTQYSTSRIPAVQEFISLVNPSGNLTITW